MSNNVTLSPTIQANLLLLQGTTEKANKLTTQLQSGNAINSALDGPTAFFAAQSLNQRATSLTSLKNSMGQAISTIQAANTGISQITQYVKNLQGLVQSAYSSLGTDAASIATRASLAQQYNKVLDQINTLAADSGYGGKNLVAGNGQTFAATSLTQQSVNSITGISAATVTNISSVDTYSLRVAGSGNISGDLGDISKASNAMGLANLYISGKLSTTAGNFSPISIQMLGAVGQTRTVVVTDGTESRTINFFDNTQAATSKLLTAGASGTAQVSSVTISGNIDEGDTFTATVNGRTFTYTASAGDVSNPATVNRENSIAQALRNVVAAGLAASGFTVGTVSGTSNVFNITAQATTGTASSFSITSSANNAANKQISLSFSSGAVVSFTVNRSSLEALGTAGDTTVNVQKNVDLAITATDLNGVSITRSAAYALGSAKLSSGENDFAFTTGTVRLNVDATKIAQAASASRAANLTTSQQTPPNTQNDLDVVFNETNTNTLTISAVNVTTSGQGLQIDQAQNNFLDRADIDNANNELQAAINYLQSSSQQLSTNLSIVQTREDFTTQFSTVLSDGATSLTEVDQNTASAELLTLQTRQSLGITSLSLANQAQQAILKLFP